ncbi:MAG: hypothetical protein J7M26_06660 [Armatimonadetes bacterium]|nr:hypothetical protein [Armatimonadota bacterium]
MVVYTMMLVGSGIPSFQLTEYLFPTLSGVTYYATPENKWAELFYKYIPSWMVPQDAGAMRAFYEGLRPGQPLPWQPWVVPVLAWTVLALALFWTYTCITVVLRRQWIENEHLIFPLVQLPLDMVEEEPGATVSPFLRSRVMWIAAAIPLLIHSWNGLHRYFPTVPGIRLVWPLNPYFRTVPWNQMGPVIAFLHFSIIGFSFLLSTDLSFSLWFFFVLFNLMSVALYAAGVRVPPIPNYATKPEAALQMLGAFFLVCGYIVYLVRGQVGVMIAKALGTSQAEEIDDSDEPMPYRVAVWGTVAGVAVIVLWCSLAGVRGWVTVLSFSLLLMISLVLTRLISEGGLLFVQAPFTPVDIYANTVGTGWLTPQEHTIHAFVQRVFMFDLRTFVMPSFMDSYKIAHETGIPVRRLMLPFALAVILSLAFSYASMIWTAYHFGAVTLSGWFCKASPQQPFKNLVQILSDPRMPTAAGWVFIIIGGLVTWLLSLARMRFTWWPLHPLGYAMGPSWPMIQLWFSTLIGWLFKVAIMRYATVTSYRRARQFFLGLVVGEFLAAGIWVIVAWVTATRGLRFFLT